MIAVVEMVLPLSSHRHTHESILSLLPWLMAGVVENDWPLTVLLVTSADDAGSVANERARFARSVLMVASDVGSSRSAT